MGNVPGGLGARWKWRGGWQGRRVYGADTRRAQAVGCATSINEAFLMYLQRTWRSGGPAEVARRKATRKGLRGRYAPWAQAVGCATNISKACVMSV